MSVAISLEEFFEDLDVDYQVLQHRKSDSAFNTAKSAHINASEVCKAVVFRDHEHNYLMAVVPASHRVAVANINKIMHKDYELAGLFELDALFEDCQSGAIPAMGDPYQMNMICDDSLLGQEQIYLEAGDHRNLVKVEQEDYNFLMSQSDHGNICGRYVAQPRELGGWFSSSYL